MFKNGLKVFTVMVLMGTTLGAMADRGFGKKTKSKVSLNLNTSAGLRNAIPFNLKSGLKYTGSLITTQRTANSIINNTLVTYQKGNTVYIIPYKQKIAVPEIKQGYTGVKFIIRPH
jgi:hypothetical protein